MSYVRITYESIGQQPPVYKRALLLLARAIGWQGLADWCLSYGAHN